MGRGSNQGTEVDSILYGNTGPRLTELVGEDAPVLSHTELLQIKIDLAETESAVEMIIKAQRAAEAKYDDLRKLADTLADEYNLAPRERTGKDTAENIVNQDKYLIADAEADRASHRCSRLSKKLHTAESELTNLRADLRAKLDAI